MKRIVSGLMLALLLIGMLTLTFDLQPVEASGTIYIRADGSIDPPNVPISNVGNVYYTFTANIYAEIMVERSSIIIDGNGYTLQGDRGGHGFRLDSIHNVTIKNTKIKGFSNGIYILSSSNNTFFGNNITANNYMGLYFRDSSDNKVFRNDITTTSYYDGVWLEYSTNNSVSANNITSNRCGIQIAGSSNNIISGNKITNNNFGIWLRKSSSYNSIAGNYITANNYGIWLSGCSNNSIFRNNVTLNNGDCMYFEEPLGSFVPSNYNKVYENSVVSNNGNGICIWASSYNRFYHNDFVDNPVMIVYGIRDSNISGGNFWDDGYPSSGNYWSKYTGVDVKNGIFQNETGSDGISDTPYIISVYESVRNVDNYPLMGIFSDFNATPEHHVQTICNSTISDFQFDGTAIRFNVTGEDGTAGFCRVTIPNVIVQDLWQSNYIVLIDEQLTEFRNWTDTENTYIYFTYQHSEHNVTIIGPYYELTVGSSPIAGVTFTINGVPKTTPYIEWLLGGSYTLEMPRICNGYMWSHWLEDGDPKRIKTITLSGTTWTGVFVPVPPPPKPVGGYSFQIEGYTTAQPLTPYLALIAILTIGFTTIRRKPMRKTK